MTKIGQGLDRPLDLDKFEDSGGLSTQKLNLGLWIVSHRRWFVVGTIALLITLSAIFYGYSIYNYIDYYFIGGVQEQQNIEDLTTMPIISEAQRLRNIAQKITQDSPQFFINNNKYDLLVKATNPNDRLIAYVDYCFLNGAIELSCGSAAILPSESKYLIVLGKELDARPNSLAWTIKDVTWQRLDAHTYPDWPGFSASHLSFAVSQVEFKSAAASGLSEKLNLNNLSFDLKNTSAYNYWEAKFVVLLLQNNAIVGVNTYTLEQFLSGQTRTAKMTWADSISTITDIKVVPDINILDDTIFMKY
jgi:hypothetical protein